MARTFNTDTDLDAQNYELFKNCFTSRVYLALDSDSSNDLDDFIDFLAKDAWSILPATVRTLSHKTDEAILGKITEDSAPYLVSIPPDFTENLSTYGLLPADDSDVPDSATRAFLLAVLEAYAPLAREPPPTWSSTRTTECEICERAVPLTYHHLVPRSEHTRALKRGWHGEDVLGSVAWLCRPCHTMVHSAASNEELAKNFYTVERLLAREDVQKWRKYASKQRWGVKRG